MSWIQLPGVQQVVESRDLVTYRAPWAHASSSQDVLRATSAHDPRFQGRENGPGFLAWRASAAGSLPYWPCGRQVQNKTSDGVGSDNEVETTPCSASTRGEQSWPRPQSAVEPRRSKTPANNHRREIGIKRTANKRRKLLK